MNHCSKARREQLGTRNQTTGGHVAATDDRLAKSSSLVMIVSVGKGVIPNRRIFRMAQSDVFDVFRREALRSEGAGQGRRQLRVHEKFHAATLITT